ncbi:flagellar basal body rod protein FlgC [Candidatus Riflebacteria bacterium]
MSIFSSFDTSASGLSAERLRMDLISNNLANVNTTRTESGGPYRRQLAVFQARNPHTSFFDMVNRDPDKFHEDEKIGRGVRVLKIVDDPSPLRKEYAPEHPDANKEGYLLKPNVNVVHEMVDMITASRAYEANITSINTSKDMILRALDIGRQG